MLISDSRYATEPNSGCYLWLGSVTKQGHGRVRSGDKTKLAHRVAWEEEYGTPPSGKMVCHKCDTPSCVNVDHLYIGGATENQMDKARRNRGRKSSIGLPYGVQQSKESSTFQVFLSVGGQRVSKCGFVDVESAAKYAIEQKNRILGDTFAN